jgi:Na+-transporting NADH:ubiquinone oxidoreductase subunit NqrD
MISKVKEFAHKAEPFVLIVASFASVEVLHTIYTALWTTNKMDVLATAALFISAILSWWFDYFDKKKVEKLLDNF